MGPFVVAADYHPGMGDWPVHNFNDPTVRREVQRVENESWPYSGSKGRHARGIDDQPGHNQRPCTVRAVFEHDGETYLDGLAIRWNRSHVCVVVDDARLSTGYLWVRAGDVKPRALRSDGD